MRYPWVIKIVLFSFLLFSLEGPRALAADSTSLNLPLLPGQPMLPTTPTAPMADGSTAFAQDFNSTGSSSRNRSLGANAGMGEYVSGNYLGAVLIPVTILGPVPKQGIHHIPTRTSLVKFLSLAGGITQNADLGEVTIKRFKLREKSGSDNRSVIENKGELNSQEEVIRVDLEELLQTAGSRGPILQQDDLILIKENRPVVGNNTLLAISVISSLLGIVVSSILIANELKK